MLWILLGLAVAVAVYLWVIKPMNFWKERGIPYIKPWPIVGNMGPLFFRQKHFIYLVDDFYNAFPDKRYIGIHQFGLPALLIRDLDLIKRVTVKDFDYFTDHQLFTTREDIDPLMGKNLTSLKGQRWRDMRATVSPSFTSSKMKAMFVLISDCAEQFTNYFIKKGAGKTMELEMKDIFTRFTNDAIATCAFGFTCDSLEERENEFYVMGKEATNFNGIRGFMIFLFTMCPNVMKFLRIQFFSKRVSAFFRRIVKEAIDMREKEGLVRPDVIHLLMEARKGRLKYEEKENSISTGFATAEESELGKSTTNRQKLQLTDDDMVAQALIFFFGGFDTSSNLMSLIAYALAVYPDIQKRLQDEVDEALRQCNGKLTYEAVMGMKYMDMVVSETLRMWPLGFLLDRLCVQDYTIEPELPDEKPITIEKGQVLILPVMGIHHDPKFFPNPDKFDPERFSDENKHNIVPYSYMPFGSGPRNCIASRFALLENKTLFAHILSKFNLVPVKKTVIPLVFESTSFNPTPKGGYWIGFEERKKVN